MPRKIIWLVIILAIIGIFDTAYLAAEHYLNSPVYCPIDGNCDKVLSSPYSKLFGIPLALFGLVFYFFVLILTMIFQLGKPEIQKIISKIFFIATLFALIFSGWLVYLQLFIIKAICIYCVISAGNILILFLISVYLLRRQNLNSE